MDIEKSEQYLEKFRDDCTNCGDCQTVCSILNDFRLSPGEIAGQVAYDQVNNDVLDVIKRCALCGLCSQECLEELNPADMFMNAREVLVQRGIITSEEYDVMLVDRDWNFFTIYRDTFGIQFEDLKAETYDTLFFPGCTLASYAPELTRVVHQWLIGKGYNVGFTEMCCGKPLVSIGLKECMDQMMNDLRRQMQTAGASRLITACPNCLHLLAENLDDIQVLSLYDLMVAKGLQLQGTTRLTIHDSCPDRYSLQTGEALRQVLNGYELVEMEHHGNNTICCGSGGIVSMIDPDLCFSRARERMSEFERSRADLCVTACMACSQRLASAANPGEVVHCLELIFELPVDYTQIQGNIKAMWDGEWGVYNLHRLSQAQIMTREDETSYD